MNNMFFIKMDRGEGSLEKLLETISARGCDVLEMTARRSLDNAFYFVRVCLNSNGSTDRLKTELASRQDVRQVEVEAAGAVPSV